MERKSSAKQTGTKSTHTTINIGHKEQRIKNGIGSKMEFNLKRMVNAMNFFVWKRTEKKKKKEKERENGEKGLMATANTFHSLWQFYMAFDFKPASQPHLCYARNSNVDQLISFYFHFCCPSCEPNTKRLTLVIAFFVVTNTYTKHQKLAFLLRHYVNAR